MTSAFWRWWVGLLLPTALTSDVASFAMFDLSLTSFFFFMQCSRISKRALNVLFRHSAAALRYRSSTS